MPAVDPDTVDKFGCPVWISALANEDPNHLMHVVRDLDPAAALELLGADRESIVPCDLPPERTSERTSLLRTAVSPLDPVCVLLAGRIGGWTFVYDDLGATLALWGGTKPQNAATALSAEGTVAATGYSKVTGQSGLVYAVDGKPLVCQELHDLAELDEDSPAEVRDVVERAGSFGALFDDYLSMRAVCVLAALPRTLDELRKIPLIAAPFG